MAKKIDQPTDGAAEGTGSSGRGAGKGRGRKGATDASDSATEQPLKTGRGGGRAASRTKQPDLKKDLRDFASARPDGWGHDDWLAFLESLQSRGHNINDRESIGIALEKERLDFALSGVKGMGPQRRAALVERFGTLWALKGADSSEIAKAGKISPELAERLKSELP